MDFFSEIVQKKAFKRFSILVVLVLLLYLLRSILDLLLLTFIFAYLFSRVQSFLSKILRRVVRVEGRIVLVFLYVLFAFLLILGLYKLLPILYTQTLKLVEQIADIYSQPSNNPIILYLRSSFKQVNLINYINQGLTLLMSSLSSLGRWGFNFVLALLLSLYYLLDKKRVVIFSARFEKSSIASIYKEALYLSQKFTSSFGKVIETQIIISFINSMISIIALWLMGFPQYLGLGIMMFVLDLIPVAGVWFSLLPLCTIAYSLGGLTKIIYVLILVVVMHALESYILNPRLMSSKMNLPAFYTLIILIIAEHFLGLWGLIVGLPIFMFILDFVEVK